MTTKKIVLIVGGVVVVLGFLVACFVGVIVGVAVYSVGNSEAAARGCQPAPVRAERIPDGRPSDWMPRPDHLAMSWFALREWVGLLAQRMGF